MDRITGLTALRIVKPEQRGRLNGAMQAGMLIGRAFFGGGALVLAAHLGWSTVVVLLVCGIWIPVLVLPCLTEPRWSESSGDRSRKLLDDLRAIFSRRSTWQVLRGSIDVRPVAPASIDNRRGRPSGSPTDSKRSADGEDGLIGGAL